jgi:hypothetical protein
MLFQYNKYTFLPHKRGLINVKIMFFIIRIKTLIILFDEFNYL